MRRLLLGLLCVLICALLCLPAFGAEAATAETRELGILLLPESGETVRMQLENDTGSSVHVYATTREEAASGTVQLSMELAGQRATVFTGSAGALSGGQMLLGTLKSGDAAEFYAALQDADAAMVLSVSSVPAEQAGTPNRLKLIFFICIWMALAVFGAYFVIALHRHFERASQ